MASTTADGPSPQVDCEPVKGEVAVGNEATGPTPQIRSPGFLGDRNAVRVRSPSPVVPDPPVKLGWLTMGRIVRVMTFQSSVTCSGMTGWMLRTFCVPVFPGPYPRPMSSWNGMLIMSATGFCAALASFSVSCLLRVGVWNVCREGGEGER